MLPHREDVGEIHLDAAVLGNREVALHFRQQGRLSISRQPGQLAFVPVRPKAQRVGYIAVGEREAARGMGATEPAVVAIEIGQLPVFEQVMAVENVVAIAIGRIEQGLFPIGEEQARQGMAEMMV